MSSSSTYPLTDVLPNKYVNITLENTTTQSIFIQKNVARLSDIVEQTLNYDIRLERFRIPTTGNECIKIEDGNSDYQIGIYVDHPSFNPATIQKYMMQALATTSIHKNYTPNEMIDNINRSLNEAYYQYNAQPFNNIVYVIKNFNVNVDVIGRTGDLAITDGAIANNAPYYCYGVKIKINSVVVNALSDVNNDFQLLLRNPNNDAVCVLTQSKDWINWTNVTFSDSAYIHQNSDLNTGNNVTVLPIDSFVKFLGKSAFGAAPEPHTWQIEVQPRINDVTFDFDIDLDIEILGGISDISANPYLPYHMPYFSIDDATNKVVMNYSEAFGACNYQIVLSHALNNMLGFSSVLDNSLGHHRILLDQQSLPVPSSINQANTLKMFQSVSTIDSFTDLLEIRVVSNTLGGDYELNDDFQYSNRVLSSFIVDSWANEYIFNAQNPDLRKFRLIQEKLINFDIAVYLYRKGSRLELMTLHPSSFTSFMLCLQMAK